MPGVIAGVDVVYLACIVVSAFGSGFVAGTYLMYLHNIKSIELLLSAMGERE